MSVRKRNIHTRLARELQTERGAHSVTRGLLDAQGKALDMAFSERDAAREQLDIAKERIRRFMILVRELGKHFEPQGTLSRTSDLFKLMEELAPECISATPIDMLKAVMDLAEVDIETLAKSLG